MNKIKTGWIKEWIKKIGTHRTCNEGKTIICPKKSVTIGIPAPSIINFCPVCGERLGNARWKEDTYNYIWKK